MNAQDIDEFDPNENPENDEQDEELDLQKDEIVPTEDRSVSLMFTLDKDVKEDDTVEFVVHHTGEWFDWRYETFSMTRQMLAKMKSNFENKVLHPNAPIDRQVPLQIGHGFLGDPGALGWAKSLKIEKDKEKHWVLKGTFKLSAEGKQVISDGKYVFMSPKYDAEYQEQAIINGERKMHGPTLMHVALTNDPVLAELPHIALSKQPMSKDVGYVFPREVDMAEVEETEVTGVKDLESVAEEEETEVEQPKPTTDLSKPTSPPVIEEPKPEETITLSASEWRAHQLNVQNIATKLERESKRSHNLAVEAIIEKHSARGVPPAILNVVKPIMLASNAEATRAITLSTADGKNKAVNIFEAMGTLLDSIPAVELGQKTPEDGTKPNSTMDLEQAEKLGREMWSKSGLVPGFNFKEDQ